jgi:hypothetical protein
MHLQLVLHNKNHTIGSFNQEIMHVLNEVVKGALQEPILREQKDRLNNMEYSFANCVRYSLKQAHHFIMYG